MVKHCLTKGLKSRASSLQRRLTLPVMIIITTIEYPEYFEPEQVTKGYMLVKGITFGFGKGRLFSLLLVD